MFGAENIEDSVCVAGPEGSQSQGSDTLGTWNWKRRRLMAVDHWQEEAEEQDEEEKEEEEHFTGGAREPAERKQDSANGMSRDNINGARGMFPKPPDAVGCQCQ